MSSQRSNSPTPSNSSQTNQEQEFIPVTHKKKRPPKFRKGKNVIRVQRTLTERLYASRVSLEGTGYLIACHTNSHSSVAELLRNALTFKDKESEDKKKEGEKVEEESSRRVLAPSPVCIVCLGLGNISESSKSRDQFALLQDLVKDLKDASIRKPIIYDPVFKEEDINYFNQEGFEVLSTEHDLIFKEVTLIYMPHCPRSMFDDLLRKNWSVEGLKNLIILGNRLDMYEDPAHPSSTSSAKAPFVVKAVSLFEILPLPTDTAHFDVFNDLALEWIPEEKLLARDSSFWDFKPLDEEARAELRRKDSL